MKVFHLSYSDINGGAARAAYRTHHALRESGIDSLMLVNVASSGDWTVQGPATKQDMVIRRLRAELIKPFRQLLRTGNPIIHSPALLPSRWPEKINSSDADVVHLHWIQGEMISIRDLARIRKPVVWTMHDMWSFCGAEHYSTDNRWQSGYKKKNRPFHESGFDLNKFVWNQKLSVWKKPYHMIGNCSWISDCARSSFLMKDWPITTIPNAINTDCWAPFNKATSRMLLNLPLKPRLCLFSSLGGLNDNRKGFDLLLRALDYLSKSNMKGHLEFVVLASMPMELPSYLKSLNFKFHFVGTFNDDISLRLVYSACDIVAIPSRQETLTNVGVEAHSCGVPVVAFDSSGMTDIVKQNHTGYLANSFDPDDFAKGIYSLLTLDNYEYRQYQNNSRNRAVKLWSNSVVSSQLHNLYLSLVPSP